MISPFAESRELRARMAELLGDIRALGYNGNPIGGFGERFVADFHQTEPLNYSAKGYDVVTASGERIQVKTVWRSGFLGGKQLEWRATTINPEHDFDALAVVLLDEKLLVEGAWQISRAAALSLLSSKNRLRLAHVRAHPAAWAYPPEL